MRREDQAALAPKILQLLPADGWQAVHGQDGKPFTSPLLCWALISTPDARSDDDTEYGEVFPWGEQAIVGVSAMRDGEITTPLVDSNFLGYLESGGDLSIFEEDAMGACGEAGSAIMTVAIAPRSLLPGELHENGITLPADLTFEDWRETVNNAEWLDRASPWILADVLTYGEQKWGEDHSDALPTYEEDPSGQRQSRMKQALWMGRRFPPGTRVPGLTYSHHRAVADLPPLEATRLLYDAAAADEYVSTRELIGRVKACQETLRGRVISASSAPAEDAALAWMPTEDDLTDDERAAMEQYAPQGRHRVAYVTGWLRCLVYREERGAFKPGSWQS